MQITLDIQHIAFWAGTAILLVMAVKLFFPLCRGVRYVICLVGHNIVARRWLIVPYVGVWVGSLLVMAGAAPHVFFDPNRGWFALPLGGTIFWLMFLALMLLLPED